MEEEEGIKGLFKAKAVNKVDAGRDRVAEHTQMSLPLYCVGLVVRVCFYDSVQDIWRSEFA